MNTQFRKLRIWCLVGLLLSIYATYVEVKAEQDDNYVALCDISTQVSCTAVFASPYGRGFGLTQYITGTSATAWNPPNGALGSVFYLALLSSSLFRSRLLSALQIFAFVVSNLLSVYLAYLLYFVLEDLCVICVSIYVVNYFCLIESWRIYKQMWCCHERKLTKLNVQHINTKKE